MNNKKTKVYIYTRVSTVMQIDGYSLEAQKNKMKNYAEFNDFKIAGEYEDALFDAGYIRKIIKNPVYCGKIAYGRRRTEKVLCSIGK